MWGGTPPPRADGTCGQTGNRASTNRPHTILTWTASASDTFQQEPELRPGAPDLGMRPAANCALSTAGGEAHPGDRESHGPLRRMVTVPPPTGSTPSPRREPWLHTQHAPVPPTPAASGERASFRTGRCQSSADQSGGACGLVGVALGCTVAVYLIATNPSVPSSVRTGYHV
jgi:hypothetical protein